MFQVLLFLTYQHYLGDNPVTCIFQTGNREEAEEVFFGFSTLDRRQVIAIHHLCEGHRRELRVGGPGMR